MSGSPVDKSLVTSDLAFDGLATYGKNETGRKLRQQRPTLEHSEPDQEVRAMSRCGHYRDSAREINAEHSENWTSVGVAAKALVDAAARRREDREAEAAEKAVRA